MCRCATFEGPTDEEDSARLYPVSMKLGGTRQCSGLRATEAVLDYQLLNAKANVGEAEHGRWVGARSCGALFIMLRSVDLIPRAQGAR